MLEVVFLHKSRRTKLRTLDRIVTESKKSIFFMQCFKQVMGITYIYLFI